MNVKKITTMPGFELLFAVSIAAIFILPSTVLAQDTRNLEISIMNGDTVINGINIKDMNSREREAALRDINKIKMPRNRLRLRKMEDPGLAPIDSVERSYVMGDRNAKQTTVDFFIERPDVITDTAIAMATGREHNRMRMRERRGMPMRRFLPRNMQKFTFENTDNNGVTTTVHYTVSEGRQAWRHEIDGEAKNADEKNELTLSNIRMLADFSSGKTTLMFDLPAKTLATAELTDSEGKVIFNDKVSGGLFNRSFALPLNGFYQLKVKQGGKTAVREIYKEN